ncbi:RNA-directed DNA polymerase, eukaryota, reverse transcriptase zinc-binding domain protein [Tanacetum coccineum]
MIENIRRRFFWGYKDEERGMVWIGWNKVLSPFEKGGLGIGSIRAKNLALLGKWWWRFNSDSDALWCNFIKCLYEEDGGLLSATWKGIKKGVWSSIVNTGKHLCWHASYDRLPYLVNLDNHGIDVDSFLCPLCQDQTETCIHILFGCHRVRLIWLNIFSLWGTITMFEILSSSLVSGMNKSLLKVFRGVCFVVMWSIWNWRNCYVHERIEKRHIILQEDIFANNQSLALFGCHIDALIEPLIGLLGQLTQLILASADCF